MGKNQVNVKKYVLIMAIINKFVPKYASLPNAIRKLLNNIKYRLGKLTMNKFKVNSGNAM